MVIKTIDGLEDMGGIRADDFVEVLIAVETSQKRVCLSNTGIVYNIGDDRFSLIEPIVSDSVPPIGRVSYEWDGKNFQASVDKNQPFEKDSAEYRKFESLLKQLEGEYVTGLRA